MKSAFAVGYAAHEAGHLSGVKSESQAGCFAMQTTYDLALSLGASPVVAEQLHDKFLEKYNASFWDLTPNVPNPQDFAFSPASQ